MWGRCGATRMREDQSTLYPVTCGATDGGVSAAQQSFRKARRILGEDGLSTEPFSSLRRPLHLPPTRLLLLRRRRRRIRGIWHGLPLRRCPVCKHAAESAACWACGASYSGAADALDLSGLQPRRRRHDGSRGRGLQSARPTADRRRFGSVGIHHQFGQAW